MNITCAAFDTLPILTYDNVAPQALQQVVVAFKPGTSSQVLDSFRDALQCRGSTIDPPNYNTLTLTGFTSLVLATGVQGSKTVGAVEVNGRVTTLHNVSATATATRNSATAALSSLSSSSSSSSSSSLGTGAHSSGASSRPTLNSDFGLDPSPSSSSFLSESSSSGAATTQLSVAMPLLLAAVASTFLNAM